MKEFNCCDEPTGEQACECIEQDLEHRVIPQGTLKLAGQERLYTTTTGIRLTRQAFKAWSRAEGKEVDPIIWFTEMGHGPIPVDVELYEHHYRHPVDPAGIQGMEPVDVELYEHF